MTTLNMIFHVVVSVYRLVKIGTSPQFPVQFRNGLFYTHRRTASFLCSHTEVYLSGPQFIISVCYHNASVNSSSAHPPPPGNPGGGTFAILSRPGGWAFAYTGATPGHLTHMFLKVPWMSSVEKTMRLWSNGLSVRD